MVRFRDPFCASRGAQAMGDVRKRSDLTADSMLTCWDTVVPPVANVQIDNIHYHLKGY